MKVDAFGVPTILQPILPPSIPPGYPPVISLGFGAVPPSPGFGTATILQTIQPTSVHRTEAFGYPAIIAEGDILPSSLPRREAFGTPSISNLSHDYPADLFERVGFDRHGVLAGPLPGQLTGRVGVPPPALDWIDLPVPVGPATWASGGRQPPGGHISVSLPAEFVDLTPGANWFDRVHILPREPIDFELFVTPVSRTYEIFNAYHNRTIRLVSVTDTTEIGATLTNLPALPYALQPFTSLLDPSSVKFAPVPMSVTVEQDGKQDF